MLATRLVPHLRRDNWDVFKDWTDGYQHWPEYWYGNHGAPPDTVRSAERCNRMGDVLCKHEGDFSVLYTGAMHMLNREVTSWHVWRDIVPQWAGREQWSWRFSSNTPQATRQSQQTVDSANPQPRHFFLVYSNSWGHNDLDILEVGNGNSQRRRRERTLPCGEWIRSVS